MMKQFIWILAIFFFLGVSVHKFDQLAQTPPMGWNSWNKFGCNVSEGLIMGIADNDIHNMDAEIKEILTNKEILSKNTYETSMVRITAKGHV